MGNFYVTFTARGNHQQRIADILRGARRRAFVLPPDSGFTVFTEEDSDLQSLGDIDTLGKKISAQVPAPVLAVLNHDDDVLRYWLFIDGAQVDTYDSAPGYFEDGPSDPAGGNAQRLADFAGKPEAAPDVESVLRGSNFVFAFERHLELLTLLGLPHSAVGYGFRTLAENEIPENIPPESILRVG
jgi:hypothetical protein